MLCVGYGVGMAQICLFKDASHLCGEPAVASVSVSVNGQGGVVPVPACERHEALMKSSVQAVQLVGEPANGTSELAGGAPPVSEPPATPAA